jgi:hypothetical protein
MDISDLYYYEAVDDVNENGENYTSYCVRPSEWRELVNDQIMYLEILDNLTRYIYEDDNEILFMFSESCIYYDDK